MLNHPAFWYLERRDPTGEPLASFIEHWFYVKPLAAD
jgi:hypothetical protein